MTMAMEQGASSSGGNSPLGPLFLFCVSLPKRLYPVIRKLTDSGGGLGFGGSRAVAERSSP
jgi:hypothetical protein